MSSYEIEQWIAATDQHQREVERQYQIEEASRAARLARTQHIAHGLAQFAHRVLTGVGFLRRQSTDRRWEISPFHIDR